MSEDNAETLVRSVQRQATSRRHQVGFTFLADGDAARLDLTYGELDTWACAIAAGIQSHVRGGDRVLLLFPPGLDFLAALAGCLYAGAVAVPVPVQYIHHRPDLLAALARHAAPKLALTARSHGAALTAALLSTSVEVETLDLATHEFAGQAIQRLALSWTEPDLRSSSVAVLQYTSGSTGRPKACMITHGNILSNCAGMQVKFGLDQTARAVAWTPHYHDMGLVGGIFAPLCVGFPVVHFSHTAFGLRPMRWLKAISKFRATVSAAPTFAYNLCVARIPAEQRKELDLGCWTTAIVGAEPVRSSVLDRFSDAFAASGFRRAAFRPCYGLAEATLLVTSPDPGQAAAVKWVDRSALLRNEVAQAEAGTPTAQAVVSCGTPPPGTDLAIVDPATHRPNPTDTVGEIWVSGPGVTAGYWNGPEAPPPTLAAPAAPGRESRVVKTGDLGFLSGGQLYVTGRCKDLIIVHGENHYPEDIEETAQQSHPWFLAGAGAAFSIAGEEGERSVLVQEVDRAALRSPDGEALSARVRDAIFRKHQMPLQDVVLVRPGTLPRTTSGKVQRVSCSRLYLADAFDRVCTGASAAQA